VKAIYVSIWLSGTAAFESVVSAGYNLVILAFLVDGSPAGGASAWNSLGSSLQASVISNAHSDGARIIISTGGSTETAYGSYSGAQYGTNAANWAVANQLDGVDFDLENFGAGFVYGSWSTATTVSWVASATNTARSILGSNAIITHAPQPPYFTSWGNDAYGSVYSQANSINFLLIQYYNNGQTNTYSTMFQGSTGSTIDEIYNNFGIPLSKLVAGQPLTVADVGAAYQSYVLTASQFHSLVSQAQSSLGWNAGVMGWQWHNGTFNQQWISTVY